MRKLSIPLPFTGFWDGVLRGAASPVEAFDPRVIALPSAPHGLICDSEAIRRDRKRAQRQLDRELARLRAATTG